MKYRVCHETTYEYGESVPICQNEARLRPRNGPQQKCISSHLSVSPRPATIAERTDYFGNHVTFFTVQEGHRKLSIKSESMVTVTPVAPADPNASSPWDEVAARLADRSDVSLTDVRQFVFASPMAPTGDEMADYARPSFYPGRKLLEAILDLTRRIHEDFNFDPRATAVNTLPSEVLRLRTGVCQDFAHLEIACLRSLGLAARYVSGYLLTKPAPGKPRAIGADVSHAWVSAFVPEFGWLDFDPTNDVMPGGEHVMLGWGRDYGDICPIKGVFIGGGRHTMKVAVDVEPA
jgi:transglutaminase-like putative cysteine protease